MTFRFVEKHLVREGFNVKRKREKRTNAIDLLELEIKKEDKKELIQIYISPFFQNKVFIESKNDKGGFTKEELYHIESKIVDIILESPQNMFTNLFYPFSFCSTNFLTLKQEDILFYNFSKHFERKITNGLAKDKTIRNKNKTSLFGIAYPRVTTEEKINELFQSLEIVFAIEQHEDKNLVIFYAFEDATIEEALFLKKISNVLHKLGLKGDLHFAF